MPHPYLYLRAIRRSALRAHAHEFDAIVGLGIVDRGTGHEHGEGAGQVVVGDPGLGELVPIDRGLAAFDREHAV